MWNLQVACMSPQSGQSLQLWNDKNKFTCGEMEICDQAPCIELQINESHRWAFVGFAVPRLNTVLKNSVLFLSRLI